MLSKLEFTLELMKQGIKVAPADRPEEVTLDPDTVTKWDADGVELVFNRVGLRERE